VINSLLDGLSKVEIAFVTEELEEAYAAYLRKTLGPALNRWGLVKTAGEPEAVSFLRPRLLYRLANEGRDATLMNEAERLARDYARDPASIDPALATNALRLAAIRGAAALFDEYRQRFETTQIPADRLRYLLSLGEFRDPALVTRSLEYALDSQTRPQEVLTIPKVISDGDRKNEDLSFQWMTGNYAAIVKRIPPDVAAFLPRFADGCSYERLERAKTFFADPAHQVEGTQKELAKVADSVTNCVSLRKREGAAVAEFLKKS
jgi:alanyl aminopeptidase